MSAIYEALRSLLIKAGELEEHPADGWLSVLAGGPNGTWLLVGQAYPELGVAALYAVFPGPVPTPRREAVAVLLTRINHGLVIGTFELDLDDGEVRFRTQMPVSGAPGPDELRPLTAIAFGTADRFVPAIKAVSEGADPASVDLP